MRRAMVAARRPLFGLCRARPCPARRLRAEGHRRSRRMTAGAPQRLMVAGASTLRFAPHMRFRFDETRQRWVLLAPEKLFLPDETAVEILKLIDGARSVDAIVDDLATRFAAPREM